MNSQLNFEKIRFIVMPKKFILLFAIAFYSCKDHSVTEHESNIEDSVVVKYLSMIDSLDFFDTTDYEYRILKAYNKNDTAFFLKMNNDINIAIENRKKFPGPDTCVHVARLSGLDADEVYR